MNKELFDRLFIFDIANNHMGDVEHGLRRRYTPAVIRQLLRHRSKNLVVARLDGALIGFGIMTYRRDSANLDLLAVRKPHRRRGVARQIVDWLEKVACTAGIANIFLCKGIRPMTAALQTAGIRAAGRIVC